MGVSRQEHLTGLPFPSPGCRPDPGIKPVSPSLAGRFFTTKHQGSPVDVFIYPSTHSSSWHGGGGVLSNRKSPRQQLRQGLRANVLLKCEIPVQRERRKRTLKQMGSKNRVMWYLLVLLCSRLQLPEHSLTGEPSLTSEMPPDRLCGKPCPESCPLWGASRGPDCLSSVSPWSMCF